MYICYLPLLQQPFLVSNLYAFGRHSSKARLAFLITTSNAAYKRLFPSYAGMRARYPADVDEEEDYSSVGSSSSSSKRPRLV